MTDASTRQPFLIDPEQLDISLVPCDGCGGTGQVPEEMRETDPGAEDVGIRACCEGLGVMLDVPEGAERLVALLAMTQLYLRTEPGDYESTVSALQQEVEGLQADGALDQYKRR